MIDTLGIGLKLWSPNVALAAPAARLHKEGWIDLLELYVVPGTFDETIATWRGLGIPYMLHCPHAAHKFNPAKPELFESNVEKFSEVQRFADALEVDVIVTHGGNRGTVAETIRQLKHLNDGRIFIENKPKVSLTGGICIGHSPEQVEQIVDEARLKGFVLDFGHATCAANSAGIESFDYIERFLKFSPRVFHIGDGDRTSEKDNHFNLGAGTYDIARMATYVPPQSTLTIETPTDLSLGLTDFVENVRYLRTMFASRDGALT
jgi:deoxyribonuclease IV